MFSTTNRRGTVHRPIWLSAEDFRSLASSSRVKYNRGGGGWHRSTNSLEIVQRTLSRSYRIRRLSANKLDRFVSLRPILLLSWTNLLDEYLYFVRCLSLSTSLFRVDKNRNIYRMEVRVESGVALVSKYRKKYRFFRNFSSKLISISNIFDRTRSEATHVLSVRRFGNEC